VAVNCAAIPDNLFETELFGHARGSFTGAERSRPGLIARAEGGTLFLDEIGELAPARQASLLRVLESRRYRPVGSDEERPANVRLVAATNVDLDHAVAHGTFRRDLLFRLDVLRLRVPPLRERPDDIGLLTRQFLERAGAASTVSPAALAALVAYPWPGNVRELEHHLQRLGALRLDRLELAHLPREIRAYAPAVVQVDIDTEAPADERAETVRALDACGGNISQAARRLGLTRHGLKKRLLRLGLRSPGEASSS
ncbi:MAG: sigma-54-dependent Fis family transcriptional regulator, partial [Myxococcales bacterium]